MFSGFLNIHKPQGMTSHDVVATVRRRYRQMTSTTKVGHAGTLDPMATGVLVVCLGHATRLSEYVMSHTKTYHATITLGMTTDTYDAEGQMLAQQDPSGITLADIEAVLPQFVGDIQQRPPAYSAIKKEGKKLYELARAGIEVDLAPRPVHIQRIAIVEYLAPMLRCVITCGAGTYIRSLAHDIGQRLGVGAHLSELVRTQSGQFLLENATTLDTLQQTNDWHPFIVSAQQALADYTQVLLDATAIQALQYGRAIPYDGQPMSDPIFGFDEHGELVAVLQYTGAQLQPHKVFLP